MTTNIDKPILRISDVRCDFQLSTQDGEAVLTIDNVPKGTILKIKEYSDNIVKTYTRESNPEQILFHSIEPNRINIFSE